MPELSVTDLLIVAAAAFMAPLALIFPALALRVLAGETGSPRLAAVGVDEEEGL